MTYEEAKRRARRAFERRFGQSVLPLTMRLENGLLYIRDNETRTWAEYAWRNRHRLRLMHEYDAISDVAAGSETMESQGLA